MFVDVKLSFFWDLTESMINNQTLWITVSFELILKKRIKIIFVVFSDSYLI
jgi:hypothetical protein